MFPWPFVFECEGFVIAEAFEGNVLGMMKDARDQRDCILYRKARNESL